MSTSQAGQDAVSFILSQIESGVLLLPMAIRLSRIADNINHSVQNIGSAFDFYIKPALATKGISARKCGTPRIIQLTYLNDRVDR